MVSPGRDQYRVKTDGSGQIIACNRYTPVTLAMPPLQPPASQPPPSNRPAPMPMAPLLEISANTPSSHHKKQQQQQYLKV